MSHSTRVFQIDAASAENLERALREGLPVDAEWRQVPYSRFSVKSGGIVLTCYTSGKTVVQGKTIETFVERFLEGASEAGPKKRSGSEGDEAIPFESPTIGSDETGKGDYFGPLVVAACHAEPESEERLREIGVADSKALTDIRARKLAGALEREFEHEVISVDPVRYNALHAEHGNINTILANLHAEAIAAVRSRCPGADTVIVDKFARESLVADALASRGVENVRLVQTPRGERHPVVAAASILARAAFLDGLDRCSDDCGTDLHKGAGEPVDHAARRVVQIGGMELLAKVAKLHFKNTSKLGLEP